MGIYSDTDEILGLRILIEESMNGGDYYPKFEFTGDRWRQDAIKIFTFYFGKPGVIIQTLHPFSTSYNISTGKTETPGNIWLKNIIITPEDLNSDFL